MSASSHLIKSLAVGVAALLLSGCITVFPKTKPAQLYRFDFVAASPAPSAPAPHTHESVGVLRTAPSFAKAVTGDRILSVTGAQAAYIADARWIAPAASLFDEAMTQAFDLASGSVRLVSRGEVAKAAYVLRVDVRNFEAVYEAGPKSAPTVVIRAHAVLNRTSDRTLVEDRLFEARVKADGNRVSAIVAAFGVATGRLLDDLVSWTSQKATSVPA